MDVSASITKITAHDVSYLTDNRTLFSDVLFATIQIIKNYINLICKSATTSVQADHLDCAKCDTTTIKQELSMLIRYMGIV